MKRVNLTKYGFVRWPEEDFSDDGNHFTCYRAGKKVRVSKLVSNGQVYLSISSIAGNGSLPFNIYSKLPHYEDANWKWNGVSVAGLTEDDLKEFYNACVLYEMEYEDTESRVQYPSLEEIVDKASRITNKRLLEISKIENLFNRNLREAITRFPPYEWKTLQEYFKNLVAESQRFNIATFPQTIVGKSASFDFVKPDAYMEDSYWFRYLKELFEKYNMN